MPDPAVPPPAPPAMRVAVLIPAAGRSTRFGRNKLLETLQGQPVIRRTLDAFLRRPDVAQIVIATSDADALRPHLPAHPKLGFAPGGDYRAASVRNALGRVTPDVEWIAVHDAARPLVLQQLIDRTFAAAHQYGAAAPATPVALTIKQAAGPLPARVVATIPRHDLFSMQTPQVMRRTDLLDAFARCPLPLDQVTDDVQLLELAGHAAHLIPGDERNLKITTPLDLHIAQLVLGTFAP